MEKLAITALLLASFSANEATFSFAGYANGTVDDGTVLPLMKVTLILQQKKVSTLSLQHLEKRCLVQKKHTHT
jgi:hypothetical protein